jgi:quercetin dioxygenase-like cupin family protein
VDVNADFAARAVVHAARMAWSPSPMPGVERRMLDRMGEEVARATSVVRYAPGSRFSRHTHNGGEEFLVLDGVFQDEHGDYPAGAYVRNPPGTSHTPGAQQGAVILVKLWQFDPADRTTVRLDSANVPPVAPGPAGVTAAPLFRGFGETVRIETWAAGAAVHLGGHGGFEAFVLAGGFREGGDDFAPQSWLRLPPWADLAAVAGPQGAVVWVKTGHLSVPPRRPGN